MDSTEKGWLLVELSHVLALQSSTARLTAGTALLLGSQQGGSQRRGAAVAQVVQTIQGYLSELKGSALMKVSSEKQTTLSYHFVQYTHIKNKHAIQRWKQYNLNMPSSYKPYIHRNVCLYKQNETTLLQVISF